jgi:ribosomal protein L11 methylase PrmA
VDLEARRLDLRTEPVPVAPTVVANLLTALLVPCAASLGHGAKRVIASGILAQEADRVEAAFAAARLQRRGQRRDGDWVALLFESA